MELDRAFAHPLWVAALALAGYACWLVLYRLYLSPLARFPGPRLAAATAWYEFYYDAIQHGKYTFEIARMHKQYGTACSSLVAAHDADNGGVQDPLSASVLGSFTSTTQTTMKSSTPTTNPATSTSSMPTCLVTRRPQSPSWIIPTIVSCDPATLARDLAGLTSYEIESLTMVDLFPETYHLETIARLRRR